MLFVISLAYVIFFKVYIIFKKILFIYFIINLFKDFIYLEGREGESGREIGCVIASHTPPTGDLACKPGMCPDWELNL